MPKVELSNGSLNDQPVANLTGLRFDAYAEENDSGAFRQPYLNVKIDADNNGSIDTTLAYVHPPIQLDTWTEVDTLSDTPGWQCQNSTVITPCDQSLFMTWTQVLDMLPAGAVFQNSLGFPNSLIINTGQSSSAARDTVRGAVDRVIWSLGNAEVVNDFEPALINAADNTVEEPATGTATGQIEVTLSGPNSFSRSTPRWPAGVASRSRCVTPPPVAPPRRVWTTRPQPAPSRTTRRLARRRR